MSLDFSRFKFFVAIFCLVIFIFSVTASAVFADTVVVNSKDWHDVVLGSAYAKSLDASIAHITGIQDFQSKVALLSSSDDIVVLESDSSPGVKNLKSQLGIKGFSSVEEISFSDFNDLQSELFSNVRSDNVVILDSVFSAPSIIASPLMSFDFFPLFLNDDSVDFVVSSADSADKVILVGFFNKSWSSRISADSSFVGDPFSVSYDFSEFVADEVGASDFGWGVLQKGDELDLAVLSQKNPVFVYFDDVESSASPVKASGVSNFEVIGPDMADIAQSIELASGTDLRLILKYARAVAGNGFDGDLLNLDLIQVPAPSVSLQASSAKYNSESGILSVSFKNLGNVPVYVFSNVEFGNSASSDANTHLVPAGKDGLFVYDVGAGLSSDDVVVSSVFGVSSPLTRNILFGSSAPFTSVPVDVVSSSGSFSAPVVESAYFVQEDYSLYASVFNPNTENLFVRVEVPLGNEDVLSTDSVSVVPNSRVDIPFELSAVSPDFVVETPYNFVTTFYHSDGFASVSQNEVTILAVSKSNSGYLVYVLVGVAVLVCFAVAFFVFKKKF